MMRYGIHHIVVAAHRHERPGGQLIERQVDGAAPGMARVRGYISLRNDVGPADVRIVPSSRPTIFRLLRPTQEALHGPLRAIPVPEQQAEAQGRGTVSRLL